MSLVVNVFSSRSIRQPCLPLAAARRSSLISSYMLRSRWWRMKWPIRSEMDWMSLISPFMNGPQSLSGVGFL